MPVWEKSSPAGVKDSGAAGGWVVCDTPTVYEQEAGTWWSFEEGAADTFYSQSVSGHFQRWEARDFVAVDVSSQSVLDVVR